jgi:hypothetical protein
MPNRKCIAEFAVDLAVAAHFDFAAGAIMQRSVLFEAGTELTGAHRGYQNALYAAKQNIEP